MRRRDFLRGSALTWAGLSLLGRVRAEPVHPVARRPVVVSTWSFGVGANREAVRLLAGGGNALDAAMHGVMSVESDPTVSSVGIGGLPNLEGVVELDAAIMDGRTLEAGSVAALRGIENPVAVARKVMEETEHVMLVGEGARRFAVGKGFKTANLLTAEARKKWKEMKAGRKKRDPREDHDTIGMVALDVHGKMAAACTTSGLAWKLPGRVGDSPLIGHGLYCDGAAGGAAATGVGEEVIKVCGSYQVVEFMRQGLMPDEAIRRVLERIIRRDPRTRERFVGFVALRADGEAAFASNTPGFEAALSRPGNHDLHQAPSVIEK